MKKTILLAFLLLCIPVLSYGQMLLPIVGGQGTATPLEVDGLITFEAGNNTDAVTADIANNSSYLSSGSPDWTVHRAGTENGAMTISTTPGAVSLPMPIKIGSTIYNASGSKWFKYVPGQPATDEVLSIYHLFPASEATVSFGGFYRVDNVTSTQNASILFGVSGNSNYSVSHWHGASGGKGLVRINSSSPNYFSLDFSTKYWITGMQNATTETNDLYLFDVSASPWLLLDYITQAGTSGYPLQVAVGREGTDGESDITGQWYFKNFMWSYSKTSPLVPAPIKLDTPTYDNDTGTYSNSVTVTPSAKLGTSVLKYCTDTEGACTPSTAYSAPIDITVDGTHLRTQAIKDNWISSAVKDATYTITSPTCTTSNDSAIFDDTGTSGSNDTVNSTTWAGRQFTVAASTSVTEYQFTACINSGSGNIQLSIYTDSTGNRGTQVADTAKTLASSALSACATFANATFTLPATKTGLAPGTYWAVAEVTSGNPSILFKYRASTGNRAYFGGASGYINNFTISIGAWGCTE